MAKVSIEFNIPEESEDLDVSLNGYKWKCIVQEIDHSIRDRLKYHEDSVETKVVLQDLRESLSEEIDAQDLTLFS